MKPTSLEMQPPIPHTIHTYSRVLGCKDSQRLLLAIVHHSMAAKKVLKARRNDPSNHLPILKTMASSPRRDETESALFVLSTASSENVTFLATYYSRKIISYLLNTVLIMRHNTAASKRGDHIHNPSRRQIHVKVGGVGVTTRQNRADHR